MPRFMMLVKASADSEAGVMPRRAVLAEMAKYNEELVKAGVMLAGEGLHPSSKGARIVFEGDKQDGRRRAVHRDQGADRRLLDHPGRSRARRRSSGRKRAPNPHFGGDTNIEVRQVFEAEDFGDALTPELREQENELRARSQAQHGG